MANQSIPRTASDYESPTFATVVVVGFAGLGSFAGLFFDRPDHVNVAFASLMLFGLVLLALRNRYDGKHLWRLLMGGTLLSVVSITIQAASVNGLVVLVPLALHIASYEQHTKWRTVLLASTFLAWGLTFLRFSLGSDLESLPESQRTFHAFTDYFLAALCCGVLIQRVAKVNRAAYQRAQDRVEVAEGNLAQAVKNRSELEKQQEGVLRVRADISQSLRNERLTTARLGASREQLDQFAYAASHDLKEPVRTIASFLQMTRRRLTAEVIEREGLTEHFAFVESSAKQMHTLLERLLLYSRAGQGEAVQKSLPVAYLYLRALAMRGDAEAAQQLKDPAASWRQSAVVETDPAMMQQVFAELIDNAEKFVANGAMSEVKFICDGLVKGRVRCRIIDQGIGIEPAYVEQVFGLFKRLHAREHYHGGGIGLTLARKLAETCGVKLWLTSIPGQGVTAHLSFPPG